MLKNSSLFSFNITYIYGKEDKNYISIYSVKTKTRVFFLIQIKQQLNRENLTFVIIVNDFQKALHCACAIKIPIISQFLTPTGSV